MTEQEYVTHLQTAAQFAIINNISIEKFLEDAKCYFEMTCESPENQDSEV